MTGSGRDGVEHELAGIEHRVLDDVWIGRARTRVYAALIAVLAVTTTVWWLDATGEQSAHGSNRIPTATVMLLVTAATMSGIALWRRRFRVACAAAYACGLASVLGIGAFWWIRTGRPGALVTWLGVADVSAILLTIGWLAVVTTPIERSQPEMRAARAVGIGR